MHCGRAGNTAADWLRAGGSAKSSRFISVYLDVLHVLAVQRFICLCLDDLQFADEESLELVQAVVERKIPCLLIVTYRPDTTLRFPRILSSATK